MKQDEQLIASLQAQVIASAIALRLLLSMSPTMQQVLRETAATKLESLLRGLPAAQKAKVRTYFVEFGEPLPDTLH